MINKSPYQILVRPVITEKAVRISSTEKGNKQYTFKVAVDSSKPEIKWAVETAYGVKVASVNTVLTKGKNRYPRSRGARPGRRPDVKKAIVTLADGQEIETS